MKCTYCGVMNDENQDFCLNCGEPLTQENNEVSRETVLELIELFTKEKIRLSQNTILGREGEIDSPLIKKDEYMGRIQCGFEKNEDGEWTVENFATINPTLLNGVNLLQTVPLVLHSGDRLKIADLYFKINIPIIETECQTELIQTTEYSIVCPVCGHEYRSQDPTFHISECSNCDDEFDKIEIKDVLPREIINGG